MKSIADNSTLVYCIHEKLLYNLCFRFSINVLQLLSIFVYIWFDLFTCHLIKKIAKLHICKFKLCEHEQAFWSIALLIHLKSKNN